MKTISVRELLLRHNDSIINLNIGRLEDALRDLVAEIGPHGENLAFITRENVFKHKQHITVDNPDGTVSTITIDPQQITTDSPLELKVPSLTRTPLPDTFGENEIPTMKEVNDVWHEMIDRTQYATEERTGVVELATQEETDAFEDDKVVVTPKKLSHIDDRLVYLETRPHYIVDTVLPESYIENTIYALVDGEEILPTVYLKNPGVSTTEVHFQLGQFWRDISDGIEDPSREYFTFRYWSHPDESEVRPTYLLKDGDEFSAFFERNQVRVDLDVQGGNSPQKYVLMPQGAIYRNEKDIIQVPFRPFSTFKGWLLEGEPVNEEYKFIDPVTFVADWEQTESAVYAHVDGEVRHTMSVRAGALWGEVKDGMPDFPKEDYKLTHWAVEEDGKDPIPDETVIVLPLDAYAVYSLTHSTVTVNVNGGTPEFETFKILKGTLWKDVKEKFAEAQREHYELLGWSVTGNNITIDDNFAFIKDEYELSAVWKRSQVVVKFVADKATNVPEPQVVNVGSPFIELATRLETPEREDYAFVHWSLEDRGEKVPDQYKFSEDITVYAVFDNVVTIARFFFGNGEPTKVVKVQKGITWADLHKHVRDPVKPDYLFQHWALAEGGDAIDDQFKFQTDLVNLHAVYVYNMADLTFETFGGTEIPPRSVKNGTQWAQLKQVIDSPTKEDYDFTHWSLSEDGEPVPDTHLFQGETTLYAVYDWKFREITLDSRGGTEFEKIKVLKGTAIKDVELPSPEKPDWDFICWSTAEQGEAVDPETLVNENITLYAQYLITNIVVTFDPQGGTMDTTTLGFKRDTTWETVLKQAEIPVREKFILAHWSLNISGAPIEAQHKFSADTTVHAVWNPEVIVLFHGNGGTPIEFRKGIVQGTTWAVAKQHAPEVTYPDYKFLHWSLSDSGEVIPDEHKFMQETTDAYAIWKYDMFMLTVDTKGGSEIEAKKLQIGTKWSDIVESLGQPTKPDNYFQWYSLTDGGDPIDAEHVFEQDTTIFVVWKVRQVTVDFYCGEETTPSEIPEMTVDVGTTWADIMETVPEPVRVGYNFTGWEVTEETSEETPDEAP